jgi:hypothetical protein
MLGLSAKYIDRLGSGVNRNIKADFVQVDERKIVQLKKCLFASIFSARIASRDLRVIEFGGKKDRRFGH